MPLILGTNSIKDTGYAVDNSCRFNGTNDYMHKTGSAGSRRKFTISFWIKGGSPGGGTIFSTGDYDAGDGVLQITVSNSGRLTFDDYDQSGDSYNQRWVTPGTTNFRDPAAWYHICVAVDSTQGTYANRVKFYLNGENISSSFTNNASDRPVQNADFHINYDKIHTLGRRYDAANYFPGYISEFCLIDGTTLDPTSFGEFDEDSGIWKPIDVSGLTFGTNGFYLDFEASGNLGNDANGGTDLTEVNLAATDQSTDTCTNNFATFNPLASSRQSGGVVVYSEGNTKIVTEYSNTDYLRYPQAYTTLGVTSGKWYAEFKIGAIGSAGVGIANTGEFGSDGSTNPFAGRANSGAVYTNGGEYRAGAFTDVGSQGTYTENDIIGCALDMDNLAIYWHKNGTYINSGDPTSGSSKTGARAVFAQTTPGGFYVFTAGSDNTGVATIEINLGSPPYSESGGETDGNGYGNFNQAVPSGYFALCTKNLAEHG